MDVAAVEGLTVGGEATGGSRPLLVSDADISDRRRRVAAGAQRIRTAALAEGTRQHYARHWHTFTTWCREMGVQPLAASADDICDFLFEQVCVLDEAGELRRDDAGRLVRKLHVTSARIVLHAIGHVYRGHGLPKPSLHPDVQDFMSGLARHYGVTPDEQRAPILWPDLQRLVAACDRGDLKTLTWRAAQRLHQAAGLTAGQLYRLDWSEVTWLDGALQLDVPSPSRSRRRLTVVVPATGGPDCPYAAVWHLAVITGAFGPVFRGRRGKAMARGALHNVLGRVAPESERHPLQAAADRVLVTAGWFSAVRRSNLSMFTWRDVDTRNPDCFVLVLRRSKTDRDGRGHHVALHRLKAEPELCPVRALEHWRELLTQELGVDPLVHRPDLPLLLPVDRHGQLGLTPGAVTAKPLTGRAINLRIQQLADRCGLTDDALLRHHGQVRHPYGAHSLRAGWATEFLARGGSLTDAARHLDQRKIDTTAAYARSDQARLSDGNQRFVG